MRLVRATLPRSFAWLELGRSLALPAIAADTDSAAGMDVP
jgi:hypothetical protein